MVSQSFQTFNHSIQDAIELLNHFDAINTNPPPANAEVLKRASLVMALAALETYIEDRIIEAAYKIAGSAPNGGHLSNFFISSLQSDLKYFHTPSTDRVKPIFEKYLGVDITEGWVWNHFDPARAKSELNKIAKKRGDIAHRSLRPLPGQPVAHAVTRDELRKHIRFICDLVTATEKYLSEKL
ncbi:HEPN domain-containing protein [Ectopseudomonas hydrolytica]|uniref:HEPN domain-containing protein n=1 Tax=Ectopseudomonas hydrolytica TaxID=2493633 RepID=A0ABY5A456_9GAMM|nr:HEPN domain-containing protein [Pseudomonas hydrolytica]USR37849.1 HEPN domain-containing protein [Pseudomonas hydrolytica]